MVNTPKQIGITFSGGGFRATVYHLGVVRYLRDSGILKQITEVVSVSGGSILAAHLVLNWDSYIGSEDAFRQVTGKIKELIQRDPRNRIWRRAFPWYWLCSKIPYVPKMDSTFLLEREYRFLFGTDTLKSLGNHRNRETDSAPNLRIAASSLTHPLIPTFFSRSGIQVGNTKGVTNSIRISQAVAASSAFPPVFNAPVYDGEKIGLLKKDFPHIQLTDGGVFDNSGARILRQNSSSLDMLLVSSASRGDDWEPRITFKRVGTSRRVVDILQMRLEQEINISKGKNEVWAKISDGRTIVNDSIEGGNKLDLNAPTIDTLTQISQIRTDLDYLDDQHFDALFDLGYFVARYKFESVLPHLEKNSNSDTSKYTPFQSPVDLKSSTFKGSQNRTYSRLFLAIDRFAILNSIVALLVIAAFGFCAFKAWAPISNSVNSGLRFLVSESGEKPSVHQLPKLRALSVQAQSLIKNDYFEDGYALQIGAQVDKELLTGGSKLRVIVNQSFAATETKYDLKGFLIIGDVNHPLTKVSNPFGLEIDLEILAIEEPVVLVVLIKTDSRTTTADRCGLYHHAIVELE